MTKRQIIIKEIEKLDRFFEKTHPRKWKRSDISKRRSLVDELIAI